MPQGERFWNPYRWVPVSQDPILRDKPAYHHRWQGIAGYLHCTLEALTPLLVGSGQGEGRFIRSGRTNQPFIPGTSLKGLIRSLAELIGNAAIPFPNGQSDPGHELNCAASGHGANWQLDVAARTFGYLNQGKVFAGLIRFTDARVEGKPKEVGPFKVAVGQPRPDQHRPFYPDRTRRKFYHHHAGTDKLVAAPPSITQTSTVYPLGPGTRFSFDVYFQNLREDELALLLYCLVLEENVKVSLSKKALGPGAQGRIDLSGPLRHKLGACKPHGAGSVKITIERMELWQKLDERYRGRQPTPQVFSGEALQAELERRLQPIRRPHEATMLALRAMLIYSQDDPRRPIEYPTYQWFQYDKGRATPLKPTL